MSDTGLDVGGDVDLGRRLQARDPEALATLYRLHRRRAFGLAYRVLGDGSAAEDAVHAAFLHLWEQADRLDPHGGRLGSLVMTVVHRRAVDLARRRMRDTRHAAPEPDGLADPVDSVADEQAAALFDRLSDDHAEVQTRLAEALALLPAEQREVIHLAYFEGLTHRAIAERLGLPGGTVKSRLRLGMQRLRRALGLGETA